MENIVNIYDFDKTIYNGDSMIDFWIYCLFHTKTTIFYLPIQLKHFVLYILKKENKKKFKSAFLSFIKDINLQRETNLFWDKNEKKIKKWYLSQKKNSDIIISGSPDFLIKNICNRLLIKEFISTIVDKDTGAIIGENCIEQEKVNKLHSTYDNLQFNFYSDSDNDIYMAIIAKKAYKVSKNKIKPWYIFYNEKEK